MTEARKLDSYDSVRPPKLTLVPTGDQVEQEDPLATTHALLNGVVMLDYTTAGRVDDGPSRIKVPNAFIQRSESKRLNNGVYRVLPIISLALEQEA